MIELIELTLVDAHTILTKDTNYLSEAPLTACSEFTTIGAYAVEHG